MNDEPHSHKKATVALVAVLLLAYVGSYFWLRQGYTEYVGKGIRLPKFSLEKHWHLPAQFLNGLYWPLRKLDKSVTGEATQFTTICEMDNDS